MAYDCSGETIDEYADCPTDELLDIAFENITTSDETPFDSVLVPDGNALEVELGRRIIDLQLEVERLKGELAEVQRSAWADVKVQGCLLNALFGSPEDLSED